MINVQINSDDIARVRGISYVLGTHSERPIYRAINDSISNSRTFTIGLLSAKFNMTATNIRSSFRNRAGNYLQTLAGPGRLNGYYRTTGKPRGFISFIGTRQLAGGRGVSVRFFRDGARHQFRHMFIQNYRGADNVWYRRDFFGRTYVRGRPYAQIMPRLDRIYRYPLHRAATQRLEDYLAQPVIYTRIDNHAADRFVVNMGRRLDDEISRL